MRTCWWPFAVNAAARRCGPLRRRAAVRAWLGRPGRHNDVGKSLTRKFTPSHTHTHWAAAVAAERRHMDGAAVGGGPAG